LKNLVGVMEHLSEVVDFHYRHHRSKNKTSKRNPNKQKKKENSQTN